MQITPNCPICLSDNITKSSAIMMPFLSYRIFGWMPFEINDETGFRSLKNGTAYQLCNTCFCNECNFIFCDIRFNDGEMAKLYREYRGPEYNKQRQLFETDYEATSDYLAEPLHYLSMVEAYISSQVSKFDKILDWGGDTGVNTPFTSENKSLYIYEISQKEELILPNGIHSLNSLSGKENSFDLITALHVFEHLSYPLEELTELIKYIAPGGHIYIEVPLEKIVDFETPLFSDAVTKKHWHEHLNFYSKKSLNKLFSKVGLEVIDVRSIDVSDDFRQFKIQQAIGRKPLLS